jgi:hypothetical protein
VYLRIQAIDELTADGNMEELEQFANEDEEYQIDTPHCSMSVLRR